MRAKLAALSGAQRTLAIVMACLLPRVIFLLAAGTPTPGAYYWELADGLLGQHTLIYRGVETAAFEPGYPLFLAAARWLTHESALGVILLQLAVACVGAVLVDRLTRMMQGTSESGLVAAALYSSYPYLIRQSIAFMEITLLSTLLLAAWCAWAERRPLLSVMWLTFATLTRAMVLPIVLFALLWLVWQRRRREAREVMMATALAVVLLAPWVIHAHRVEGAWLPTRNGENLYVGNNAYAAQMLPRFDLDLLPDVGEAAVRSRLGVAPGAPVDPATMDRSLSAIAIGYMLERPARTVVAKAKNLAYYFSPRLVPYEPNGPETTLEISPNGRVAVHNPRLRPLVFELAHAGACALVFAAALAGWIQRRRLANAGEILRVAHTDALLLFSIVVFALVAVVYFPTTRMRAPIDPIFMAYAGGAFGALLRPRATDEVSDDVE